MAMPFAHGHEGQPHGRLPARRRRRPGPLPSACTRSLPCRMTWSVSPRPLVTSMPARRRLSPTSRARISTMPFLTRPSQTGVASPSRSASSGKREGAPCRVSTTHLDSREHAGLEPPSGFGVSDLDAHRAGARGRGCARPARPSPRTSSPLIGIDTASADRDAHHAPARCRARAPRSGPSRYDVLHHAGCPRRTYVVPAGLRADRRARVEVALRDDSRRTAP